MARTDRAKCKALVKQYLRSILDISALLLRYKLETTVFQIVLVYILACAVSL